MDEHITGGWTTGPCADPIAVVRAGDLLLTVFDMNAKEAPSRCASFAMK